MKKCRIKINTGDDLSRAIDALRSIEVRPLIVTIEKETKKRSIPQNRRLWSSVINDFQKQGRINGEMFEAEDWHYHLKKNFLPGEHQDGITLDDYVKWKIMPDGELKLVGSTTKLTTKGASNYLEECYAYGATMLDIRFTVSLKEAAILGWRE